MAVEPSPLGLVSHLSFSCLVLAMPAYIESSSAHLGQSGLSRGVIDMILGLIRSKALHEFQSIVLETRISKLQEAKTRFAVTVVLLPPDMQRECGIFEEKIAARLRDAEKCLEDVKKALDRMGAVRRGKSVGCGAAVSDFLPALSIRTTVASSSEAPGPTVDSLQDLCGSVGDTWLLVERQGVVSAPDTFEWDDARVVAGVGQEHVGNLGSDVL